MVPVLCSSSPCLTVFSVVPHSCPWHSYFDASELPAVFSLHPLFFICGFFHFCHFFSIHKYFPLSVSSLPCLLTCLDPAALPYLLWLNDSLLTLHYHSSLSFSSFSIFSSLPLSPVLLSSSLALLLSFFFLCVSTCMLVSV